MHRLQAAAFRLYTNPIISCPAADSPQLPERVASEDASSLTAQLARIDRLRRGSNWRKVRQQLIDDAEKACRSRYYLLADEEPSFDNTSHIAVIADERKINIRNVAALHQEAELLRQGTGRTGAYDEAFEHGELVWQGCR